MLHQLAWVWPDSCALMMNSGCRLLVRKLPGFLRPEDKESLLKFFGAIDVTVMSQNGAMVSSKII